MVAVLVWAPSSTLWAEPLLTLEKGEPQPAAVSGWSGAGKKIELTVKEGVDPQTVATAIEASLDRVRVKLKAGKLLVIGMEQAPLLKALADIELGSDDLDVLAEAAAMEDDFDTGSSLRAKKAASLKKRLRDRETTVYGRVVAVKSATFPRTRITVRILRGPRGELGKKIRKGRKIHFQPVLPARTSELDYSDAATVANVGAWFLKKNDRVRIKVGKQLKNGYEAQIITR
ncbi:MAG: hypothetical protein AAFV29_03135 [Myxococcota bacterium]